MISFATYILPNNISDLDTSEENIEKNIYSVGAVHDWSEWYSQK